METMNPMLASPTSAAVPAPIDRPPTVREVVGSLMFYGAFYLGSIVFVLAGCVVLPFRTHALQAVAKGWSRWHAGCCRALLGIRIEQGQLPARSDVLYAIRHESFFEAIDLPARFSRPVIFAKEELLRIPLWGVVARRFGLIGVDRSAGASALRSMVRQARERAKGRPLIIFPEGTRVRHDRPAPLQAGFAGLYKLLGLPVVPVSVHSGALYHRRWKRAGTIRYVAGPEIPPGLPRAELEARVLAVIAPQA
ncbi:1-acyl-sn-glycerol-3-phosphate acyltransferase [Novosphingobium sp. FKTRR1]|uniref:lysophospholipid acyltransferase family protein n=1 Tax=Novosphingobium sp. FKTRR1 TaxID=2879118 RepID=UPI001CF06E72|nr:lysophospholipid acyltransferase family protein [Novosphingobium sp. FKTRR1]